jgi:hypothetical protein
MVRPIRSGGADPGQKSETEGCGQQEDQGAGGQWADTVIEAEDGQEADAGGQRCGSCPQK